MRHILPSLISHLEAGDDLIIASIIESSGSAPRTSGARMLLNGSKILAGSVGGGAVEGACEQKAYALLAEGGEDCIVGFNLSATDAANLGMVCGGAVSILLQRPQTSDLHLLKSLYEAYKKGTNPILATLLPSKTCKTTLLSIEESAKIAEGIIDMQPARNRQNFLYDAGEKEYYIEHLIHPGRVHIMGAGHVGLATASLAKSVGFEVVVVDDRAEFASIERFPEADEVHVIDEFRNCCPDFTENDYVVIITRGHSFDRDVLAQALKTPATYIGMIGSSKKRKAVYDSLLEGGYTQNDIDRVHSPIGLPIGADTPAEIGLSIVAELIQARAKRC